MANNDIVASEMSAEQACDDLERPAKRLKTLACMRCRKRKQKCDNRKPCSNCVRSNERCFEVPTMYRYQPQQEPPIHTQVPSAQSLAYLADLASLEERISILESRDNGLTSQPRNNLVPDLTLMDPSMQASTYTTSTAFEEGVLTRSAPAMGLLSTFASSSDHGMPLLELRGDHDQRNSQDEPEYALERATEEALFDIYNDKVQCRYPFLRYEKLRNIKRTRCPSRCEAFFVNMIFSIGLLLEKNSSRTSQTHQDFYRIAVTRYLSHVFAQPDQILHIQAYLMLAMHAMYSPSTERIITIASATMRSCVMAQLHSAAAEPERVDAETKVHVQMRRRVFWCAYMLDRTVGVIFDLPFSIPDGQITVKMYANINDRELEKRCAEATSDDPQSLPGLTDVSAALHVVYCRQIQSEILNTTLHRDFNKYFNRHHRWRLRVLEKLDKWRSLCHRYTDVHSRNFTSSEWLNMIYNYSLALLYQPTKASVLDSAGDWTVRACVQACLIFRKFQRETPITELWLGLIMQFRCGVALLYCFFATPPHKRSPVYELPEVAEAVRACSITLAIIAERWVQSRCIRDAFDVLAREIPLFELVPVGGVPEPRKIRQESSATLLSLLKQLEPLVVHRETMRMIREVATEDFPSRREHDRSELESQATQTEALDQADAEVSPSWHTGMTEDFFQPFEPHLKPGELGCDELESMTIGFPGDFDFTGLF